MYELIFIYLTTLQTMNKKIRVYNLFNEIAFLML